MKLIVCLGAGDQRASDLAQELAKSKKLPYRWVLDSTTEIVSGVYHTSVYDISLAELLQKLPQHCEIVVLDQSKQSFQTPEDFIQLLSYSAVLGKKQFDVTYQNPSMQSWILLELENNSSFCIAPFISVQTSSTQGSHCCVMRSIPIDKFDFYGEWSKNIRSRMLKAQTVDECKTCWQREQQGMSSLRKDFTKSWSSRFNLLSREDLENNIKPLVSFIVLDNKCNAMCRTCEPASSSMIAKEYKKLGIVGFRSESNQNPFLHVSEQTSFFQVVGGEPTVNKTFFEFLDQCISTKKTDMHIEISTNASVLSQTMIDYALQFPNMKFSISVDGFDRLNSYIRWPIDWTRWKKNVDILTNLNKVLNFNTVVSLYNIGHLHKLYEFLEQNYATVPCSMNLLENPKFQQYWIFPHNEFVLQDLNKIKQLKRFSTDYNFQKFFSGIEQQMLNNVGDSALLKEFFKFNDLLDQSRSVQLRDYNPELDKLREGC